MNKDLITRCTGRVIKALPNPIKINSVNLHSCVSPSFSFSRLKNIILQRSMDSNMAKQQDSLWSLLNGVEMTPEKTENHKWFFPRL